MHKQSIPIEDDPCDVISKAMRGLGVSEQELADLADIEPSFVRAVLEGAHRPDVIEKIASPLELSPTALNGLFSYKPDTHHIENLYVFVSPFGHAGVNSYLIKHGSKATLIDTGTDAKPIADFAHNHKLTISRILITHQHHDHVTGLRDLMNIPTIYPENTSHGEVIETEGGNITAVDVSGHCTPARAYIFSGLKHKICAVGDSIFAGSMGGTKATKDYPVALETARKNIMTLSTDTIICPGHGPLTTVGEEKMHNPFLNVGLMTGQ
ncbi:MAG: MBL fold metallo-hydrolase [Akkermansiaceae bacterium]